MSLDSFAGINFDDPELKNIMDTREKTMCPQWKTTNKDLSLCDVNIMNNQDNSFILNGTLKENLLERSLNKQLYIRWWAANTPTFNSNFSEVDYLSLMKTLLLKIVIIWEKLKFQEEIFHFQ